MWQSIKHLPGEQAALANCFSQKERLICLLLINVDLCSFSFSNYFLVTVLLGSFHANSYDGEVYPVGQVSSVREFGVFLQTEDAICLVVSHFSH